MTQTTLPTIKQPWSGYATFWLGTLLIICYLIVSGLNLGIGAGIEIANQGIPAEQVEEAAASIGEALALDGDFNTINYIICFALFCPLIIWFAKKRKATTAFAYLGFENMPSKKTFFNFTLIYIGYAVISAIAATLFNIETPASMIELYQSTQYLWLSLFAVVICAPIIEEIFFRGFLFKGWSHSPLGATGSILLTSVLFVLIHAGQYDLTILAMLSVLALILGFARYKTNSIYIPIYLHFLNNLYSSVEMYFLMN